MLNPNGTSTLFCLDAHGNFHRLDTTIRPLGPRSDLLMAAAGDQGHVIKNICRLGDLPVHMYASKTPRYAVFMPRLCIRTYYMAMGTGKDLCMVPYFTPENSVEFKNDWTPPEDCRLLFVYAAPNCYLLAAHLVPGKPVSLRCLPMPNLYDDGRICMGNWAMVPGAPASAADILASALTFFSTSMWNTDLNGTTKRNQLAEFMRFTVDGKQLPPVTPWDAQCPQISSASYNWVAGLF